MCSSGLHNYVVFTGFEVGHFFLDRYLLAQNILYNYAMGTTNHVSMVDKRETLPMSYAFDLVIDTDLEETRLR